MLFGPGPAKDVLVATGACVLLLISSASVAMASRLMFKRYLMPMLLYPYRGGDTSMAGMAIAIPGVLNISKTGDTMGKIR